MLGTYFGSTVALLACVALTAPIRQPFAPLPASPSLNPAGLVVVYPGHMRGWVFQQGPDDSTACLAPTCQFVQGPGTPLAGTGSADLLTQWNGELSQWGLSALMLSDYKNTRFDQITDLRYANYRGTSPVTLEISVDYDLTDALTGSQGRLVFDPGVFTVPSGSWQTWDAKAGKWYGTQTSVQAGGLTVTNPCVLAKPCTWSELLSAFPNLGVHASLGRIALNAKRTQAPVHSNVDKFEIGIAGEVTMFDFEQTSPVPASPPPPISQALYDSLTQPLTSSPTGTLAKSSAT